MSNVTITVPSEIASEVLAVMEARLDKQKAAVVSLEQQVKKLKSEASKASSVNGYSSSENELLLTESVITRLPSGRAPRGESKTIITEFLKSKPNEKLTFEEVVSATGGSPGTVYRVLHNLRKEGLVKHNKRLWKWAQ